MGTNENFELSILIGVVFIFLICLCIIAFCVIRQQYKFKQLERKRNAKRRFLFANKRSKLVNIPRPHHVISVSPSSFHHQHPQSMIYSPQSSNQAQISPITPIIHQSPHHLLHKQYTERTPAIVQKHEGDVTKMIEALIDQEEEESQMECKADAVDRRETDISYDELMKEEDGSSEETQCSQIADDEFEVKEAEEDTVHAKEKEISIVIDDDMISLMSMSEGGKYNMMKAALKAERHSNVFDAIQEEEMGTDDDDPNLF